MGWFGFSSALPLTDAKVLCQLRRPAALQTSSCISNGVKARSRAAQSLTEYQPCDCGARARPKARLMLCSKRPKKHRMSKSGEDGRLGGACEERWASGERTTAARMGDTEGAMRQPANSRRGSRTLERLAEQREGGCEPNPMMMSARCSALSPFRATMALASVGAR